MPANPRATRRTFGSCDIIYQDVSVKEQADMLMKNSPMLKKGGYAYFVIKSQSVDISKRPELVFREELRKLEGSFEILERMTPSPMTATISSRSSERLIKVSSLGYFMDVSGCVGR